MKHELFEVSSEKELYKVLDNDESQERRIILTEGRYRVNRTLQLSDNDHIVGRGEVCIELLPNSNCHVFSNRNYKDGNQNISVKDIKIEGNGAKQIRTNPDGPITFACAFYLKNVTNFVVENLVAESIRQTVVHFNNSKKCRVVTGKFRDLGWSGISTSKCDDLVVKNVEIINSGLDIIHSAVHLDGGIGGEINVRIRKSTGNGVMLDSKFSELFGLNVKAIVNECKRGVSCSGAAENRLHGCTIEAESIENREVGIMVSNSDHIWIRNSVIRDNGSVGILFQGRSGGCSCIVSSTQVSGHLIGIEERHNSANNCFIECQIAANGKDFYASGKKPKEAAVPEVMPKKQTAVKSYKGKCCVCDNYVEFAHSHYAIRESFRCPDCRASIRQREIARLVAVEISDKDLSIEKIFKEHLSSLDEISFYEPGIIGSARERWSRLPGYVNSYLFPEVALGTYHDGIRNENLEALTFRDSCFDIVVTQDILEHVRHPWEALNEIFRVLKPGGVHIFSIPVLDPLPKMSRYRVDTTGDEDIFLVEPRYHTSGDGGKSLVYTDFGYDIKERHEQIGFSLELVKPLEKLEGISRVVTFRARRP